MRHVWQLITLTGLLLLVACAEPAPEPECGPICVSLTATADAEAVVVSVTPDTSDATTAGGDAADAPPTDTPAPATDALATAQAEATAAAVDRAAAQATATAEAAAAVAADAAREQPIREALPLYGVDPNEGRLGWIHEPLLIDVEGFQQYTYRNMFAGTVARDFVMSADITWNTQFGTTGCGFVIRSDGNEDAVSQYLVIATRGAQGHVGFIVQEAGEVITDDSVDIYANGIDPLFEWQNDTTNRLTVVGRGDNFRIYTNDTLIGELEGGYGYNEGFVAFVALNESGNTRCQFDNAWLWLLES